MEILTRQSSWQQEKCKKSHFRRMASSLDNDNLSAGSSPNLYSVPPHVPASREIPINHINSKSQKSQIKRNSVFSFMSIGSKNGDLRTGERREKSIVTQNGKEEEDKEREKGREREINRRKKKKQELKREEQLKRLLPMNSPSSTLARISTNLSNIRKLYNPAIPDFTGEGTSNLNSPLGRHRRSTSKRLQRQSAKNSQKTIVQSPGEAEDIAHSLQLKLQAQQEQEYRIAQAWLEAEESRKMILSTERSVKSAGPKRLPYEDGRQPALFTRNSESVESGVLVNSTREYKSMDWGPRQSGIQMGSIKNDVISGVEFQRARLDEFQGSKDKEISEQNFKNGSSEGEWNIGRKCTVGGNIVRGWLSRLASTH